MHTDYLECSSETLVTRGTAYDVLVVNFFVLFQIIFCFVVATCIHVFDLVHGGGTIHGLSLLLTACGNLFGNMSDARKTATVLAVKEGEI